MTPSVPASPDVLHRVDLEVAAHDSRLHDLELAVFELRTQVEILTAQANTKPPTNYQKTTRQELKANLLAFQLLRHEAVMHPLLSLEALGAKASDLAPTFGDEAGWQKLVDYINAGRPDPFGKPSDDTKALVIRILERF